MEDVEYGLTSVGKRMMYMMHLEMALFCFCSVVLALGGSGMAAGGGYHRE